LPSALPTCGGDGGGRVVGVLTRSARSTGAQQRARQAGAETHGPAELCPRTHTHLRSCRRTQSLAVTADCALYIWVNVRQGTGWCRCWCHDNCWAGCVGRCQWLLEELRAGLRHGDARAAGRGLPYLTSSFALAFAMGTHERLGAGCRT
jgi:hypothetical protein